MKLFPSWKIAILLQQQQFIFCFCALLLNPNYYCAWWQNPILKTKQVCTFHKPAPKHEMREGRVSAPWTGMLYFVFCFCFISIIVHLNWQEREKKKYVMCFWKKILKKNLRPKKKNYSISNSRVHVGWHRQSQWIKITTVQLLHIVTYPCCHHMIWKDRSIKHYIWIFLNPKKVSHHWSPTFLFLFWLLLYCFMFPIIILYVLFMTAFYIHHTLLLVFYFNKNHHPLEVKWKHLWRHVGFHFLKRK